MLTEGAYCNTQIMSGESSVSRILLKMFRIILTTVLIVSIAGSVTADRIYTLIRQGKLAEAADSLSQLSTASRRDGNVLFFQSLLESDALQAVHWMEAALNTSVDAVYREEIFYRLAQYYFGTHQYTRLGDIVNDYQALWEEGKYASEMERFSIAVDQQAGAYESAIRQVDRYLLRYSSGKRYQWGMIDKARLMLAFNKRIGAVKLLRKLSREKQGPAIPQSLYLLARDVIKRKRTDDAVFYYNILREGYPYAVGLDALVDRMSDMPAGDSESDAAEEATGTYYSVQVGVFSRKDNAKRQAELFKSYGHKVEIKKRKIADVTYRVVYVGHFRNFAQAVQFKKSLEASHNEAFRVVAR